MWFGLVGTLPTSYVEYNLSLVDDCLQVPSRGCHHTVAFWVQCSDRNTYVLSTARMVDGRNSVHITMNSDFLIHTQNGKLFVDVNRDTHWCEIEPLLFQVTPGIWYHIAFAYRDILEFRLYINFLWKTISITYHSISMAQVKNSIVTKTFMEHKAITMKTLSMNLVKCSLLSLKSIIF